MSELSLVHALGLEIPSSRLLDRFSDFVVQTPGEAIRPLQNGPLRNGQQPQHGFNGARQGRQGGGPHRVVATAQEDQGGEVQEEVKTNGDAKQEKQETKSSDASDCVADTAMPTSEPNVEHPNPAFNVPDQKVEGDRDPQRSQ